MFEGDEIRIGVLRTGDVVPALVEKHGEYYDMFSAMLAAPGVTVFEVNVVGGDLPGTATEADAWLVTGSRHGVYDGLPWIDPLKDFLRQSYAARIPLIGICFGHQIIAEALGGRAEKFHGGWGLGVNEYNAHPELPEWARSLAGGWSGYAVHQDQVTEVPPGARVIGSSDFCSNAALIYGPEHAPLALSVQPHPEFNRDFVADVIDARLADVVPADRVAAARASLNDPVDNSAWTETILKFLKAARGA